MKPEKLEFCGVKSYTDKVTVDFDKLLKGGLFGIFGNTGSGKSTILDCIFLALYGRLPKSSDREDYINTVTKKCFVRFSFSIIIDGERKTYEVYREFQAKGERKNPPQPVAKIFVLSGDEKHPVEDNTSKVNAKIQEIIGLDIDDFEKCIVLPQGQFSAFVTLKRADRLQMMSGLFNLGKYGERLEERLKAKLFYYDSKIQYQNGLLAGYSEVDEKVLTDTKILVESNKILYEQENVKYLKIQEKFNDYKQDYERHNELLTCNETLARLSKDKQKIEKYKTILSLIEPVKKYYSLKNELNENLSLKTKDESEKISLTSSKAEVEKSISDLKEKLSEKDSIKRSVQDIIVEVGKLELLSEEERENKEAERELVLLRKKYSEILNLYNETENLLKNEKSSLDSLKNSDKYLNLDKKINFEIDKLVKGAQSAFIKNELDFLKSLNVSYSLSEIEKRISLLSEIKTDDICLENCVKTLNELYGLMDEYAKISEKHNLAISSYELKLSEYSMQLSKIKLDGENIRKRVDKTNEKIYKITKGELLHDKISALNAKKNDYETFLSSLEEKLDSLKNKLNSIEIALSSLSADISNKESRICDIKNEMSELEAKFPTDVDIAEVYAFSDETSKLNEEIENYRTEYASVSSRAEKLTSLLSGKDVNDETYTFLADEVEKSKQSVNILLVKYNNLLNDYRNLSQNFEKRCKIEDDLKLLKKEKSVVSDLFECVKYKKFLEYIAEEYLAEIALDARSILLELTSGRFGLIYSGEFFVEDYIYSSGTKRKVDSVSGGELFLVSLSLALALSKCIYAKSSRPMEFFFLDEGFGSLDKDLIDVVVDCLYKLKNSDFSIGIISHVDALKERLPVRINVTGATGEKGSSITITA